MQAHPHFPAARDLLTDGIAALYGQDRRLRGLVQFDRAICFLLISALDAAYDPEVRETWLTAARLNAHAAQMGVTGDRRIAEIVASLRHDGFVESVPAPHDRRARLLRATEKMVAADLEWLETFHAPLALLWPGERYQPAMANDRGYQRAYRIAGLDTLAIAARIMRENPEADYFIQAEVGIRVLTVLMREARGSADRRTGPGFYTLAADQSGASRTHVRNLLQGAADKGYVGLSNPPGRYVEVLPNLEKGYARWVAECLSAMDLVCGIALRDMHAKDPAPRP